MTEAMQSFNKNPKKNSIKDKLLVSACILTVSLLVSVKASTPLQKQHACGCACMCKAFASGFRPHRILAGLRECEKATGDGCAMALLTFSGSGGKCLQSPLSCLILICMSV
jgi:hypothetical protein